MIKRIRRWMVAGWMGASLLIAMAVVGLWIRGGDWIFFGRMFLESHHEAGSAVWYEAGMRQWGIYSRGGWIGLMRSESSTPWMDDEELAAVKSAPTDDGTPWDHELVGLHWWGRERRYEGLLDSIPDEMIKDWSAWTTYDSGWRVRHCLYAGLFDESGGHHHEEADFVLLSAPVWLVVMLTPWAVYGIRVVRRSRRRAAGLCPQCGYDLRATPARCPECGREIVLGGSTI